MEPVCHENTRSNGVPFQNACLIYEAYLACVQILFRIVIWWKPYWLAALRCIHGKHSRRVGTITQMLRNLSKYLCYLTEHGKSCHQSSILSVNFWVIPTSPRKDVLTLILSKKELTSDRDENPLLDNRLPRSNQTLLEDDGIHLWVTKDQWFKAAFAHTSVWKRCSLLLKKWLLLKKLVQG